MERFNDKPALKKSERFCVALFTIAAGAFTIALIAGITEWAATL